MNFSRNSALQFEITRTTPGNFGVALLDAANHARTMAIPIDRRVAPGEIDRMFVWEGAGMFSSPNIPLASGKYYLYVENLEEQPITVNYKLTECPWFPGPPWENAEHYLKRSPISLAGNITTPTMIITGEADHRTPMSESEQLYQALKLRKVDVALVRVPGASHDIAARPSHLIAHTAYVLQWFETHRKK
jgi:pimeloyl-ACP methyl ester carboxylesterase